MLKNLKLTTILVIILVLFSGLLTLTGFLFYASAMKANKNFINAHQLSIQQEHLSDSVRSLVKTRVTISRVAIRMLKNQNDPSSRAGIEMLLKTAGQSAGDAERLFREWQSVPLHDGQSKSDFNKVVSGYQRMHDIMLASIDYLKAGDYFSYSKLETQDAQVQLEKALRDWRSVNNNLMAQITRQNQEHLTNAFWTLLTIGMIALLITISVWMGLKILLLAPVNRLIAYMREVSSGNLALDIQHEGSNELGMLVNEMKMMKEALSTTIRSVDDATQSIFTGASEIAAGSLDLSSRTEQQAAALEETASSMEEITSTVILNAANAKQASEVAREASEIATQGGQTMSKVIANMAEISESSEKISGIIGIIDGIAFQTNILALNAAVEAARAGEQGRGFAVVAGEVRSLAGRSASAANEIKMLIEQSAQRIRTGSAHASDAGKSMSSIVTSVGHVTMLMEEIAMSSDEQKRGIELVNKAITEMDGVTQQNAALVEESASAAYSLEDQAKRLSMSVAAFNIEREPTVLISEQTTNANAAARKVTEHPAVNLSHNNGYN